MLEISDLAIFILMLVSEVAERGQCVVQDVVHARWGFGDDGCIVRVFPRVVIAQPLCGDCVPCCSDHSQADVIYTMLKIVGLVGSPCFVSLVCIVYIVFECVLHSLIPACRGYRFVLFLETLSIFLSSRYMVSGGLPIGAGVVFVLFKLPRSHVSCFGVLVYCQIVHVCHDVCLVMSTSDGALFPKQMIQLTW